MTMADPRAIVIPFGVPAEGRGLGLGLAALVHAFVQVDGDGVGLARLQSEGATAPRSDPPGPVEAFVAPSAWLDIAGGSDSPRNVSLVLTGAFEPPTEGQGTIKLLVFDARSGKTKATLEAPVDEAAAGATLVGAFEQLWSRVGGDIGALQGLRELGWDALQSVLMAERCALLDPVKGARHDQLAAMLHLGRAIADAPLARYPAARLAAIALETAATRELDPKLASAAARALQRAAADAPTQVELPEGLAALFLRLGSADDARRWAQAAVSIAPHRPNPHALMARALRAGHDTEGALRALQQGLSAAGESATLQAEQGEIFAERGERDAAVASWRAALASEPLQPAAFEGLASHALRSNDLAIAQWLVDAALAVPSTHPDVTRWAVRLALGSETEGLARASRLATLCTRVLEHSPNDVEASLVLARSLAVLGQKPRARSILTHIERTAPTSLAAAEAQVTRLGLDDERARVELDSVLRAAAGAPPASLADVAARARRLATHHGSWQGWLAAGVAERRRGRLAAARGALEAALETAQGAAAVHAELVEVLVSLGEAAAAVHHAERALALEGESPRAFAALARTLAAAGRHAHARAVVSRGLQVHPRDERLVALLLAQTEGGDPSSRGLRGALARLKLRFGR